MVKEVDASLISFFATVLIYLLPYVLKRKKETPKMYPAPFSQIHITLRYLVLWLSRTVGGRCFSVMMLLKKIKIENISIQYCPLAYAKARTRTLVHEAGINIIVVYRHNEAMSI